MGTEDDARPENTRDVIRFLVEELKRTRAENEKLMAKNLEYRRHLEQWRDELSDYHSAWEALVQVLADEDEDGNHGQ